MCCSWRDCIFPLYGVICPRFDIRVWHCDIELATLEFHNATLKFDNTALVFHATSQLRVFNFTPTIRHAQLSFYARFNMLGCHFMLVSLFNSRHAWMINRGNMLYFCGLNPILRVGVSRKTLTSDLRPRKTSDLACEQAHLFGWGAAIGSWREEWGALCTGQFQNRSWSPPPGQTPGHLTFWKNFGQIPHYVASLEGQMPQPFELQRGSNPPPSRHVKATVKQVLQNFQPLRISCSACLRSTI